MKRHLRLITLAVIAGLLCTVLFGRLPRAHAGNPVQVFVTITRVVEKQCDEGFSEPCPNDFYARVGINNMGIDVSNRFGDNTADVSPNATFTRTVDSDLGTIPIFIELDDHDSTSSDDVIDISPNGERALGLTLDLRTGEWSGVIAQSLPPYLATENRELGIFDFSHGDMLGFLVASVRAVRAEAREEAARQQAQIQRQQKQIDQLKKLVCRAYADQVVCKR